MKVRELTADELAARNGVGHEKVAVALGFDEAADGSLAFGRESFDSELLGLEIGRILDARAPTAQAHQELLSELASRARGLGFAQVLRRVDASDLPAVWALERSGFELMDVGVSFVRRLPGPMELPTYDDLVVRPATEDDVRAIVSGMAGSAWGSRYESDPAYTPDRVQALRTRWLWNSYRHRADAFLVGVVDRTATAGYVTCCLDGAGTATGEIELVGTLPAFRRRRVAARILEHALAWFSNRASVVLVRTQATNVAAAALYEQAGFTLHASDLTFRLSLDSRETPCPPSS
ncbi:Acetyltransferase (GNAT) family protein [Actinopolymorpha cephalotaxi]|uniref:Acetyltransferase (GNAT) family protein n=1 Tax=Actinopolymorpha cephalotaxi TaxID=504797 RepID=A0A1I2TG76_9ACTN|nr:GNAT family N-acetyltransferase [Actinopolymorpha cephalotaxi]NYH82976.1 ribosomal protein S18 acetylase RimI-like enzyme [Actinopolymorpha cephalotaxi]SFG61321.1 Acetyltransferase (GNAT) family protein [Actinopolymorpha cephalotaxi]